MKRLAAAGAVFASLLAAQQRSPHAGYVYPAGGRQGSSVEVRVGGQFLEDLNAAYVSGKGVEARIVQFVKPLTGPEAQKLRDEMKQLQERKAASRKPAADGTPAPTFTAADQARIDDIRQRLEDVQRKTSVPAIAEIATVRVTIAPDAAPGPRQLRLETAHGLTNPVAFVIGDLPEISRKPARVAPAYNVVNGATPVQRAQPRKPDPPTEIALPAVLNGQMTPGAADQYRFHAAKGQRLVIAVAARELIPYVSDAVPGWFQAVVTLRDAHGEELATADHFLFHPDPLLEYDIPADGDYIAEIRDSLYRGREDFVYRIRIGELPTITGIFPLGGRAGKRTPVELSGWNLPAARATENFGKTVGVYPVSARGSNSVPFAVDSLPETAAKPGIGAREKAQRLKLPAIVNGRIATPGEIQFFRIQGRAGEQIVAEVIARRLGSPLDSTLRLTDAAGKELAFNDDFDDKGAGLITHQADSYLSFALPAKGTYYLQLADAQRKGGPDFGYRLRVSHPRPDFELRVTPSSLNLRAGTTALFTVYALRRDGFAGPIALKLKNAPPDFAVSGAAIPAGQDKVRVTLTAPGHAVGWPLSLQLIGEAAVEGRPVTRIAVPAEDMEQAFAYHHLVVEDAWLVHVAGGPGGPSPWRSIEKPLELRAGAVTAVDLFVPPRFRNGLRLALNEPPEGISIQSVTPARDGVRVVFQAQADKAKPGLQGNLIVDAFREPPPDPSAKPRRSQPLGVLPAIPFAVTGSAAPGR